MLSSSSVRRFMVAVLIGVALFWGTVTAGPLTYAIGDKVDLSGTAYTTNTMYLFVTGPGLDPNGVNPGQMKTSVVTGYPSTFVQVDVENDTWHYIWNTAHQGFSLRDGIYTIYAVSQPVAKNALPSVYGSIEIILSQGGVSVPASGTVSITTSPPGAAVFIDSQFVGNTPASLTAAAGNHTLRIESPGYRSLVESLPVNGVGVITIERILVPVTTIATTTIASPTTETSIPNPSPVSETTPQPVSLAAGIGTLATAGAVLLRHHVRKR